MTRSILALAACIVVAGSAFAADAVSKSSDTDLALQLERERNLLKQLQERLEKVESQTQGAFEGYRRLRLKASLGVTPLDQAPAVVTAEGLRVERTVAEKDLIYKVSATNIPVIQVLEAVARTSGLRLDLHPDAGRASLLGRVFVDMQNVEMGELLELIAGTQALGAQMTESGILIGPLTALSHTPIEKHLRDLSMEAYQNALLRFPASAHAPGAYLGIARYYAGTGYYDAAIQALHSILDRYPKSDAFGAALLLLGDCYSATQRHEHARAAYYRYVDTHPTATDLPDVLMKIGPTWTREAKWSQAVPVYESILREFPQSEAVPYARMRLAECLSQLNQYEVAVTHLRALQRASTKSPFRDELNLILAECLVKLKQYGNARVCLTDVVRKSQNAVLAERACYALGDTFLAEGKTVEAVEAYECARHTFPRGVLRAAAPVRLARAYQQMGLYTQVEKELSGPMDGISFTPDDFRALTLARCNYWIESGQPGRVLTYLGSLPSLLATVSWPVDPELDPETLLVRARAHQALGQAAQARQAAVRVSKLVRDEALLGEACRIIGDCETQKKDPLRAAMAYGGKTE